MFFDWQVPLMHMDELLNGIMVTIIISIITFIGSFLLGIVLGVLRYIPRTNPVKSLGYILATIYVEVIRNTPALVQIYLIYFGLPQFGIKLQPLAAGIIALVLNNASYLAEIVRAGLQSIATGQHEAAESIGLNAFNKFRLVIFPQAVQNIFPALGNQLIMIIFGTSLLSIIDVRELTDVALILNSSTFRTIEIFITITIMYYVLTFLVMRLLSYIEKKMYSFR